jgi:hypothetical protein
MAAFLCKRSRRRTGFGGWPRGGRAVARRHSGLSVWHPNGHRAVAASIRTSARAFSC